MNHMMNVGIVTLALWAVCSCQFFGQERGEPYAHVPSTISPEAQAFLRMLPDPNQQPAAPAPTEIEEWKAFQQAMEAMALESQRRLVEHLRPELTEKNFGGVPVLEIKPRGWQDNGKVLVYTHGGGFTMRSAGSSLAQGALTAAATGVRVISVDYTLAPHAKWQEITDQVVTVFGELRKQGYAMEDLAIFGDSAGGGLAAATVLKLRDKGMGMPAAVVLYSPWADVSCTGDTFTTLKRADPLLVYELRLENFAAAYASPADHRNPYVSPVYGDFSKGYPPTLIQGGTKEVLLSDFVRLYQALDTAGQTVKLDLYEGMPHVFQVVPGLPESKLALAKVDAFLEQHLGS